MTSNIETLPALTAAADAHRSTWGSEQRGGLQWKHDPFKGYDTISATLPLEALDPLEWVDPSVEQVATWFTEHAETITDLDPHELGRAPFTLEVHVEFVEHRTPNDGEQKVDTLVVIGRQRNNADHWVRTKRVRRLALG